MAHATAQIIEIPQPAKVEHGVRLDLTADEAATLATVCGMVTGSPNSPRKHTDAIWFALKALGVEPLPRSTLGSVDFRFNENVADAYGKANTGDVPRPKINRFI